MPAHPIALALITAAGVPLAAPSANRFTQLSPTTAEHVRQGLGTDVDLILNGGPCTVGIESTVLSLVGPHPVLLRPGGITRSGLDGSYRYAAVTGREDKPVNWVSWYDSIRFANWLNNGQGSGDTETGAYTLGSLGAGGVPTSGSTIVRNPGAQWFLPSLPHFVHSQPSDNGFLISLDLPSPPPLTRGRRARMPGGSG